MPFSTYNKDYVDTRDSGISNTLLEELDDQIGPLPSPAKKKKLSSKSRNRPRYTMSTNNVLPEEGLKAIKEDISCESSPNSSHLAPSKPNTKRLHVSEKNIIKDLITPEHQSSS